MSNMSSTLEVIVQNREQVRNWFICQVLSSGYYILEDTYFQCK